jgi:hypothetical protein
METTTKEIKGKIYEVYEGTILEDIIPKEKLNATMIGSGIGLAYAFLTGRGLLISALVFGAVANLMSEEINKVI